MYPKISLLSEQDSLSWFKNLVKIFKFGRLSNFNEKIRIELKCWNDKWMMLVKKTGHWSVDFFLDKASRSRLKWVEYDDADTRLAGNMLNRKQLSCGVGIFDPTIDSYRKWREYKNLNGTCLKESWASNYRAIKPMNE